MIAPDPNAFCSVASGLEAALSSFEVRRESDPAAAAFAARGLPVLLVDVAAGAVVVAILCPVDFALLATGFVVAVKLRSRWDIAAKVATGELAIRSERASEIAREVTTATVAASGFPIDRVRETAVVADAASCLAELFEVSATGELVARALRADCLVTLAAGELVAVRLRTYWASAVRVATGELEAVRARASEITREAAAAALAVRDFPVRLVPLATGAVLTVRPRARLAFSLPTPAAVAVRVKPTLRTTD